MDNGASSYRRFLDGDESAFDEIMHIRHRKVIDSAQIYETDISEDEKTLEETVLADEQKRIINAAVSQLPEDMRIVIHLIYFEDMTYEQAAKVMKKNTKQIDNLLYRAKKELRTILRKSEEYLS